MAPKNCSALKIKVNRIKDQMEVIAGDIRTCKLMLETGSGNYEQVKDKIRQLEIQYKAKAKDLGDAEVALSLCEASYK